jgi:hypothetical protein
MGGLGLRSHFGLREAAFVGVAAKAVPALVHAPSAPPCAQGHFCTSVISDKLNEHSFAAESDLYDFSRVTSSGCEVGSVLASAWPRLQQKAAGGGPAPLPPLAPLRLTCPSSVTAFRTSNTPFRLSLTRPRSRSCGRRWTPAARARAAFCNQDEFLRAFLLARPAPGYALTSAEWRECVARYLGAPSPACAPFVGQRLHVSGRGGDGTVDVCGDNLLTACTSPESVGHGRHHTP